MPYYRVDVVQLIKNKDYSNFRASSVEEVTKWMNEEIESGAISYWTDLQLVDKKESVKYSYLVTVLESIPSDGVHIDLIADEDYLRDLEEERKELLNQLKDVDDRIQLTRSHS